MLLFSLACSTPSAPPAPAREPATTKERAVEPAAPKVQAQSGPTPGKRRVVAIGDLHADHTAAVEVLQLAGLADASGHWTGGATILVQTGDLTDRGPESKEVIDLMRRLQTEASAAGGEVRLLNGNHEIMNLRGDWRYVSEGDLAGFGGKLARAEAFSPTGTYGSFLATLPVATQVDDTVFVHGGIHPDIAAMGLDAINERARAHYFDPMEQTDVINDSNGPTWFRGYAQLPEDQACPLLEQALTSLGAKRMVVGHTAQRTGAPLVRCEGKFTVIDIGISAHYGHHLGAWEALEGDARVLLPTGPKDIVDP